MLTLSLNSLILKQHHWCYRKNRQTQTHTHMNKNNLIQCLMLMPAGCFNYVFLFESWWTRREGKRKRGNERAWHQKSKMIGKYDKNPFRMLSGPPFFHSFSFSLAAKEVIYISCTVHIICMLYHAWNTYYYCIRCVD